MEGTRGQPVRNMKYTWAFVSYCHNNASITNKHITIVSSNNKYLHFSLPSFWVLCGTAELGSRLRVRIRRLRISHAVCISFCITDWKAIWDSTWKLFFLWWQKKKKAKLNYTNTFQASSYVKSTDIPLAKASRMSKSKVIGWESTLHPLWGHIKGMAA